MKLNKKSSKPQKTNKPKKPKILVVEDDKDTQELYKNILTRHYNIVIAGNALEAYSILENGGIDLMILDVILPKLRGDKFFVNIKSKESFKKLKTIVVTVIGDLSTEFKRVDSAVSCIAKPFTKEQLITLINKKLRK